MVLRIDIEGEIGSGANSADVLVPRIKAAGAAPIIVRIDSPGGALIHALKLYDALTSHRGPVTAVVAGRAASAAILLVLAGDVRRMVDGAYLEFHAPHMGDCRDMTGLDSTGLREWADILDDAESRVVDIIVGASSLNAATARGWMMAQRVVEADDAIAYGLADEIAGDVPRVVASPPRARFGVINSRHTSFRPVMTPPPLFAVGRHAYAAGTRVRHGGKTWMALRDIAAIVVNAPGVGRGWQETT